MKAGLVLFCALGLPAASPPDNGRQRPRVVVFLGDRCPCAYNYQDTFAALLSEYRGKADFLAVFIDKDDDDEDVKVFLKTLGWDLPHLIDTRHEYMAKYQPPYTTEALLLSPSGKILYRGAIDDSALNSGQVKRLHLKLAIEDYLHDRPIEVKETEVSGCTVRKLPAIAGSPPGAVRQPRP